MTTALNPSDNLTDFQWIHSTEDFGDVRAFGLRFAATSNALEFPRLRVALRLSEDRSPREMARWLRQLAGEVKKAADDYDARFESIKTTTG